MRVLSLDGGVGACTYSRVLQRLEHLRPGFLSKIDMIVGSSAGSCAAVYLAHLLDEDKPGHVIAEKLVSYIDELLVLMKPSPDAYKKFLAGNESMVSNIKFAPFIAEKTGFQKDSTVSTKLSLLSTLSGPPYAPEIHTNWGSGAIHDGEHLVEVAVRSAAVPIYSPARMGHFDGIFFVNNPAMAGLAKIAGELGNEKLDDVVMLSLGGDDGSSNLSNRYLPGDAMDDLPHPKPIPLDVLKEVPNMPVEQAEMVMNQAKANLKEGLSKILKIDWSKGHEETIPGNQDWGWKQWLAYPGNIAYLLQVFYNSHGRGASWQCEQLLGERILRLAPVGLMSMNEAMVMMCFGQCDDISAFSALTARLWGEEETSIKHEFAPDLPLTLSWIDYHWMD